MAHNIAFDAATNQHMVFTAGPLPWHKLGQNVQDAQDWQAARRLAHLDWQVTKVPMYMHAFVDGKMQSVKIQDHVAVIRQDTREQLGIVGTGYEIIQNDSAFAFTEALLETGALYESAGALGNGARIWVLARIPQADFTVGNADAHRTYLCFTTSHDGSLSAVVKLTEVRIVCENTLSLALSGSGSTMKIRHTASASDRLRAAQRMVTGTVQNAQSIAEKMNLLARRRLTRDSMTAILDKLFPVTATAAESADVSKTGRRANIIADVLALYDKNDNNAFPEQRGTAYNLLNAVTNYTDHVRTARVTNGNERTADSVDAARAESAMWGTGSKLKESAFQIIDTLTKGSESVTFAVSSGSTGNENSSSNSSTAVLDAPVDTPDTIDDIAKADTFIADDLERWIKDTDGQ